jgi:GT2 family glycosyltransferase
MTSTKVAICIPSRGDWKSYFALSLIRMLHTTGGIEFEIFIAHGAILPANRHTLVEQRALAAKASHVLFLDDDMVFHRDLLKRLLSHEVDVVGAVYPDRRSLKPQSICWESRAKPLETVRPDEKRGLMRVEAIGTGALLIRTGVFQRIEPPWFLFTYFADARRYGSEDFFLCDRLRQAGVPIHADPSIRVGHIGDHVFSFLGGDSEVVLPQILG